MMIALLMYSMDDTIFTQPYLSSQMERALTRFKTKNDLFWLVWHFLELECVTIKWNMKTGEEKWTSWDRQALPFCSEAYL